MGTAGRLGIGFVAGDDPRDLFRREARGFAASMVQGIAARVIGDSALEGDLNPFAQNALHGLAGGGAGYIIDGAEGIAPGAAGAIAAHWMAGEAMENGMSADGAAKLAAMAGSTFGCVADWAQEGSGALGVDIGGRTGAIAAEQNLIPHVILAGMLLYEAGDVAHTYLTQGPEAALKSLGIKLGVSAATIAIGGSLLKGTISALLARSPALARALGKFGDLLLSASEAGTRALGKTAIGRRILATDAAIESAMDRSAQTLLSSLGARKGVNVTFKHKPGSEEVILEQAEVFRPLLPGEGKVGTFKELKKISRPGDNLTPNHIPQFSYMEEYGVLRRDGISFMMEQPVPGTGGRHRATRTYGARPDHSAHPRQELARDIFDMRRIYTNDGVYTPEIRKALQEVIEQNKITYPHLFEKFGGK